MGQAGSVPDPDESAADRRRRLVASARALAADQDGIVSRAQLRGLGVNRWLVRTEVTARRWRSHGQQTIAVHTADLDQAADRRRAVLEVGADAALDGVTALLAAGLTGFSESVIHVSVSRGTHPRGTEGTRVHETRRRRPEDVIGTEPPRVRPQVAAVRAALWAKSDRQAALLLVLTVQQGIATPASIAEAFTTVTRAARRAFLDRIIADLLDGAQALGELDFARMVRARGLPEPSRQVVRQGPKGRVYLDVYWADRRVAVEIDGIHHATGRAHVEDALRQNHLTLKQDLVLRIPLLGLRLHGEEFMDQVAQALRSRRPEVA